MSEVNGKKMFYRLRSLRSIFEYKELENQEIYFASLDELNDPMEGFRNVLFKGDKIVWRNLLRHYLVCLNCACIMQSFSYGRYEFKRDSIPALYNFTNFYPVLEHGDFFTEINQDYICALNKIMNKIAIRTTAISRDELLSYLESIHSVVLQIIYNTCKKNKKSNLIKEIKKISESIDINEKYLKQKDKRKELLDKYFHMLKSDKDSNYLNKLDHYGDKLLPYSFISFGFIDFYMQELEKLICPTYYVACFMEKANNSSVWGHYGDGHRGICLVFEAKNNSIELCRSNKKQGQDRLSKYYFEKIHYDNSYNEINFFETIRAEFSTDWYTDEKGNKSQVLDNLQNKNEETKHNVRDTLLHKMKDWEYETEYRIIDEFSHNIMDKEARKLKYQFKDLHGIIFGIKTSTLDKLKIFDIIRQKCQKEKREDFKFYQAYYCKASKKIKFCRLDITIKSNRSNWQPTGEPNVWVDPDF